MTTLYVTKKTADELYRTFLRDPRSRSGAVLKVYEDEIKLHRFYSSFPIPQELVDSLRLQLVLNKPIVKNLYLVE